MLSQLNHSINSNEIWHVDTLTLEEGQKPDLYIYLDTEVHIVYELKSGILLIKSQLTQHKFYRFLNQDKILSIKINTQKLVTRKK